MLLDFSLRVQFSLFVVSSGCTEGDVHLAGGESVMEGRVEVCQNQTWWAVSGYWYWGLNDATVVCRHLHYPANCEQCNKYLISSYQTNYFVVSYLVYRGEFLIFWILNILVLNFSNTNNFCALFCTQGQFPCPLHSLGEAMPQYWFEISDVLEESSHSSSVHPVTTPSLLITLMDIMYLTGMFTQLNNSSFFTCLYMMLS